MISWGAKALLFLGLLGGAPAVRAQAQPDAAAPESPVAAAPGPEAPPTALMPGAVPAPATDSAPAPADSALVTQPSLDATPAAERIDTIFSSGSGGGGPLDGAVGLGEGLWKASRGEVATRLMRAMPAQSASRYAHILLRRALLTRAEPPAGAAAAGFVSARAHLLLRMGEAESARMVMGMFPQSAYTRQSYAVAVQAHLAALDLPGACPLARKAIVFSQDVQWPLLSGVCSALDGDEGGAALGLDIARQEGEVNDFDLGLAEQMVTALSGGGRGGEIDWPANGRFTTYRVAGVYSSGQRFPAGALLRASPAVQGWLARNAAVDSDSRWPLAWAATADGVMSGSEFASLWALRGARMDPRTRAYRPEGLYERCATLPKLADRQAACRSLLAKGSSEKGRAALLALLATPAVHWPLRADQAGFAPTLVRGLVMGGNPAAARRWWPLMAKASPKDRSAVWGLLAVALGGPGLEITPDRVDDWVDAQSGEGKRRRIAIGRAAFMALGAGISAPFGSGLGSAPDTVVYQRLADAARRGARGEVVMFSHLALSGGWGSIEPSGLLAVLRALRSVGLVAEARMIAAEAIIMHGG